MANSHGGRLWRWTEDGHREEVVESTISLPLHTVGTGGALTEAGMGKTNKIGEGNYMASQKGRVLTTLFISILVLLVLFISMFPNGLPLKICDTSVFSSKSHYIVGNFCDAILLEILINAKVHGWKQTE